MQALLQFSQPVTDDEIVRLSERNAGWRFEREADGALVVSPPTGSDGDARNAQLTYQLVAYAKRCGGIAFGSSAGFTLPDRSMRSPDGAWIATERWTALTAQQRAGFAPIVPDVWIELRSQSDTVAELRAKLASIRALGAAYVVLIDPYERRVWADGTPPHGFELDADTIFDA